MAAKKYTATMAKAQTEDIKHKFLAADTAVTVLRTTLLEFDDRDGPKAMNFDNFGKWAQACLPWGESRCYKLLREAQVDRRITALNKPDEEIPGSHLLAISNSKIPDDDQARTYQQAVDLANVDNEGETVMPKDRHIKAAIKKMKALIPVTVTDSRGTAVSNDESEEVMAGAKGFDPVLAAIGRLKTSLKELASTPAGAMLPQEMDSIERARTRMYQLVRFCRPFAECVYCNATGKASGKLCRACKGRRWLNESIMKQASKETHNAATAVSD